MFQFVIGSTKVLFSKFFSATDKETILAAIGENTKSMVFLDTGATPVLAETIAVLSERGIEVSIRDHHRGEGRTPEAAESIEALLGERAKIVTRVSSPACAGLITTGEFSGERMVIIADPDLDGLTAAMKAAGVVYDGLDSDADVFDVRPKQSAATLTPLGWTACRSLATLPAYNSDRPQVSEDAKAELFSTFVKAASGDEAARASLETRVVTYEAGVAEAERLLASVVTEATNGVWLADTVGSSRFDLSTLSKGMEGKGAKVTVVRKGDGPIAKVTGIQFSLAASIAAQKDGLDLRTLVPEGAATGPAAGLISNVAFLLHCSEQVWQETILPALRAKFSA